MWTAPYCEDVLGSDNAPMFSARSVLRAMMHKGTFPRAAIPHIRTFQLRDAKTTKTENAGNEKYDNKLQGIVYCCRHFPAALF